MCRATGLIWMHLCNFFYHFTAVSLETNPMTCGQELISFQFFLIVFFFACQRSASLSQKINLLLHILLCGITMYFYLLFVFSHRAGSSCQTTAQLVQIYSDTAHQNIYYDIRIWQYTCYSRSCPWYWQNPHVFSKSKRKKKTQCIGPGPATRKSY